MFTLWERIYNPPQHHQSLLFSPNRLSPVSNNIFRALRCTMMFLAQLNGLKNLRTLTSNFLRVYSISFGHHMKHTSSGILLSLGQADFIVFTDYPIYSISPATPLILPAELL